MFYAYYDPRLYLYQKNNNPDPATSPRKYSACPSSSVILQIMLVLHSFLYLLGLVAVPVLQNKYADHQQAAEMMVVGTCGVLTSSLAIMGLWYHQRQFLLPLLVFLFAMICIDIMVPPILSFCSIPGTNRE